MVLLAAPTSLPYAPGAQTPGQSSMMKLQADSSKLNNLNKLSTGGRRRKRKGGQNPVMALASTIRRGGATATATATTGTMVVPILPTAYSGTSPVDNTSVMTQSYKLSANATAQSALDKAAAPATMPVGVKTGGKRSRRRRKRSSRRISKRLSRRISRRISRRTRK